MPYRRRFLVALALLALGLVGAAWAVVRLGGWRYTAHRLLTQSAWPTYTQRRSQLDVLPSPAPGDVVLLGDSHVAQGQWCELAPDLSPLNRGTPGEGIAGLRAYAKTLDLGGARAVAIQVGTNDLLFHPPAWVRAHYDSLLADLAARDISIIACTLPGVSPDVRWTGIDPADVAEVNDWLRELPERHAITICDLAASLGTAGGILPPSMTDDGVHLRGAGYVRWARALRQSVAAAPR